MYDKPTINIILISERLKAYPLKIKNKTLLFDTALEVPSQSNQTRKRKGIRIGQEEINMSLFADEMVLCTRKA